MPFYLIAFVIVCLLAFFDIHFVAVLVYFVRERKNLKGRRQKDLGGVGIENGKWLKYIARKKITTKKIMPAPENSQLCFSDCLQMKETTGKAISIITVDIEEKKKYLIFFLISNMSE